MPHEDAPDRPAARGAETLARDAERKQRLAEALRENLRKRKTQARGRKAPTPAG
jgi:hypothetical protein